MIIDKSMLAKFLVTVIVVGAIGYYAMYSLWPTGPISTVEPLDPGVPAMAEQGQTQAQDPTVEPPLAEPPARDYFVDHRMERERERSERVDLLREIVNNTNSSAEARTKAQMEMIELSSVREQEHQVERLIVGKGFADAVIFFGQATAEVIVKAESMTESEALSVADVVCTVTGINLKNVRVRFRK